MTWLKELLISILVSRKMEAALPRIPRMESRIWRTPSSRRLSRRRRWRSEGETVGQEREELVMLEVKLDTV